METVTAIATIFIALLALSVSIWHGVVTRRHNRLSLRPHLCLLVELSEGPPEMGIFLENNGLGPAIIKSIAITIDGNKIDDDDNYCGLDNTISKLGIDEEWVLIRSLEEGSSIKVGEKHPFIRFAKQQQTEDRIDIFREAISKVGIEVIYESLYGITYTEKLKPAPY